MTIEDIKEVCSFLQGMDLTRQMKKIFEKMHLMIEMSELEETLREKGTKLQNLSGIKK